MMRSLFSGVSGLKTHQTRMDVIGNNIANVNTVAYKSSSMTFQELMYQTTQSASGADAATGKGGVNAKQIGLGVTGGAIYTNITTPGAAQNTGDAFDLRLNDDSFFVVSNGVENFYTRAGAFYVDGVGNLAMKTNGYNVMGWAADDNGVLSQNLSPLQIMSAANMTSPPEATSLATVSGILDKMDPDLTSAVGEGFSILIYDSLGYEYTVKFSVHEVDKETGEYTVQLDDIIDSQGKTLGAEKIHKADLFSGTSTGEKVTYSIEKNGTTYTVVTDVGSKSFSDAQEAADYYNLITGKATPIDAADLAAAGDGEFDKLEFEKYIQEMKFDMNNGGVLTSVGAGGKTLDLNLGTELDGKFSNIKIDFSSLANSNNKNVSSIDAKAGDAQKIGAGKKLGALSNIAIQTDGGIYLSYDNGNSKFIGMIAVAGFANASGLEKQGENLYSASLNSGDATIKQIASTGGSMVSGQLEMSNVDLSTEFTEMITTQRGFQANSRIITTSDSLLEELVNLKR